MIVNTGFCADDGTDRPLIQRSVIFCNGNVVSGVYELSGDEYAGDVKRCDPQCCDPVNVNCGGSGAGSSQYTPLERVKLSIGAVAVTLSPPVGTDFAIIENIPIGSGRVRWNDIAGDPPVGGGAAGEGHFLMPGTVITYAGAVDEFTMIRDSGLSGVVEVTFCQNT